MTTFLTQAMSAISGTRIPKYWIAYFRENFKGEINDQILEVFKSSGLTKADIARKLERRPEQVTRWLSAPCNLEADTISDLALSLGFMPRIRFEKIGSDQSNAREHKFVEKYEQPSKCASSAAQKVVCDQPRYGTNTGTKYLSTNETNRKSFSSNITHSANVTKEVA